MSACVHHGRLEKSPTVNIFRVQQNLTLNSTPRSAQMNIPHDESIRPSSVSVHSFVVCIPSVDKISNGYNYYSDYQGTEKVNDNGCDYDENCYYCYI